MKEYKGYIIAALIAIASAYVGAYAGGYLVHGAVMTAPIDVGDPIAQILIYTGGFLGFMAMCAVAAAGFAGFTGAMSTHGEK